MEELRCCKETAVEIKNGVQHFPTYYPTLGISASIPVVIDHDVPVGIMQFCKDGELVLEIKIFDPEERQKQDQ